MSKQFKYKTGIFTDIDKSLRDKLWLFLNEPNIVTKMMSHTDKGRPAAEGIATDLLSYFGSTIENDRTKQFIGYLIRQIMEINDYSFQDHDIKTKRNPLFSKASIYIKNIEIKYCRYCLNQLNLKSNKTAKICYHCGRYQNIFLNNLSNIALIISIGLFTVAILQFKEAKQERYDATKALQTADNSLSAANVALQEAIEAKTELQETNIELRKAISIVIESSYIQARAGIGLRMGAYPKAKQKLESNLGELSEFVEPDSSIRENWWNEIYTLFPED